MKRLNNHGAALIFGYFILSALLTLSAGYSLATVNELNNAKRHRDETVAFWAAEGGLNRFWQNTSLLNTTNPQTITVGGQSVTVTKSDTSTKRIITATTTVNGSTRSLQMEFAASTPPIFANTMSTGGNIYLGGLLAKMDVYGKTRLTGTFSKAWGTTAYFEDKVEGQSSASTTMTYPDANNNGTADEFNDFKAFNQALLSTYNSSEVIYVQTNSTTTITPSSANTGKKIIYVEGTTAGSGDVNVIFGSTWADNQNLTIISTGTVTYLQPLQSIVSNSKMNTISWDDYYEPSFLLSAHDGVNYAHDQAEFLEIIDYSWSEGATIAKTGITANEALAWKRFYHDSSLTSSAVPPGFEGLVSTTGGGYSSTPSSWKEI